jgi:tetratricopeptide (TPR) repeat protein
MHHVERSHHGIAATDLPGSGYGLITFFDALHDLGDPIGALVVAREALAPDGVVLLVEVMAGDRVEDNLNPALASSLEGLGYVHLRRGELRQAIVLLERRLQICRQWQVQISQYVVETYLGYAYALVGRDAQAVELLAESAATDSGFHPRLCASPCWARHLLGGRWDLADRPEGSKAVILTFDGLRNAKVRDKDTRVRITLQGPLAAHLWRLLGKRLTDEEKAAL